MHVRYLSALIALIAILLLGSCESVTCPLENTVELHCVLYDLASTDTLTVSTIHPDTVLLNRHVTKTAFELPMSYYADEDTLLFCFAMATTALTDTVLVAKTNLYHTDDPSCPTNIFHTITQVRHTQHKIDSISITDPAVNYDVQDNLHIYLHP